MVDKPVMKYTDGDGKIFELRPMLPYNKDNAACQGCAFGIGGTPKCANKKHPCIPTEPWPSRRPLLNGLHVWVQVWDQGELF